VLAVLSEVRNTSMKHKGAVGDSSKSTYEVTVAQLTLLDVLRCKTERYLGFLNQSLGCYSLPEQIILPLRKHLGLSQFKHSLYRLHLIQSKSLYTA